MPTPMNNPTYYDAFSDWYEKERHDGYHAVIDELQVDLVLPHCVNRDILEVGCGTGLLLERTSRVAATAKGIDISPGMLAKALERGLDAQVGDVCDLPFEDGSFDTIYSFKVLSHVEDIRKGLSEMARVTRPGGRLFLEFYNRHSIRYLAKRATTPGKVSDTLDESAVFTRWYSPEELIDLLPPELELVDRAGVRIVTPAAAVHKIPGVRRVVRRAEFMLRDTRLSRFGGFLVLGLRRV